MEKFSYVKTALVRGSLTVRSLYFAILWTGKIGDFAWMLGWGSWFLWAAWLFSNGGSLFIPFTGIEYMISEGLVGNGLLALVAGLTLGMGIARFTSYLLKLPGAAILFWIAKKPGNEDLLRTIRPSPMTLGE